MENTTEEALSVKVNALVQMYSKTYGVTELVARQMLIDKYGWIVIMLRDIISETEKIEVERNLPKEMAFISAFDMSMTVSKNMLAVLQGKPITHESPVATIINHFTSKK